MPDKLLYADQTVVHPLALALWALGILALLAAPRSRALIAILFIACFIPPAQRITILGFDFTLLRLAILFCLGRVVLRRETANFVLCRLDAAVIAYVTLGFLVQSLQSPIAGVIVFNAGTAFDVLGTYFVARVLLRDWSDLASMSGDIVAIALPVALLFVYEKITARNVFSSFGGIDAITSARQESVRAQGAYPHAIIAGCFWVGLLPLIVSRWWTHPGSRGFTLLGVVAALTIVVATASSTPLAGIVMVCLVTAFYPFRRLVRYALLAAPLVLIGLQLAMKSPVWHLISRIDLVGGSTGWHRYHLIDQAIRRFPEWWLLGTGSTAHWGVGLTDVTNQYVLEGVRGGLAGLVMFLVVLVIAMRAIFVVVQRTEGNRPRQMLSWMLGVSIWSHAAMFLAIAYFGQIYVVWYITLAAIASLEQHKRAERLPATVRWRVPSRLAAQPSWEPMPGGTAP